jgi:hypothetical protein
MDACPDADRVAAASRTLLVAVSIVRMLVPSSCSGRYGEDWRGRGARLRERAALGGSWVRLTVRRIRWSMHACMPGESGMP